MAEPGEGGSEAVVVASFDNHNQARLVRMRLESEGIPVFVRDEDIVALNPLYSNAVGGIKLAVPPAFAEEALAIVADIRRRRRERAERAERRCPRCGSTNLAPAFGRAAMTILGVITLGLWALMFRGRHKCRECGHIW